MDVDTAIIHQTAPATKNKWYAVLPLSLISRDFKDTTIQLQEFTIPRIYIGEADMTIKGVTVKIPNRTYNPSNKTITFHYLIDSLWNSYYNLYQWVGVYPSIDNPTPNSKYVLNSTENSFWTIPIYVYLLDEFKNKIIKVTYFDCWPTEFAQFDVAYTSEPDVMAHSFAVNYSRHEVAKLS
jgi:hypothetical protein